MPEPEAGDRNDKPRAKTLVVTQDTPQSEELLAECVERGLHPPISYSSVMTAISYHSVQLLMKTVYPDETTVSGLVLGGGS